MPRTIRYSSSDPTQGHVREVINDDSASGPVVAVEVDQHAPRELVVAALAHLSDAITNDPEIVPADASEVESVNRILRVVPRPT